MTCILKTVKKIFETRRPYIIYDLKINVDYIDNFTISILVKRFSLKIKVRLFICTVYN